MKNLYAQMALTFRLSLPSMARILKKTENEVYEDLGAKRGNAEYALRYLWNVETAFDSEEIREAKERKARNFLNLLISVQKSHDESKKQALLEMLLKEEKAYFSVKRKVAEKESLEMEDVEIISRYRVKYGISQRAFEQDLGINRDWLNRNELKITDPELRSKLNDLNEHSLDRSELYIKHGR